MLKNKVHTVQDAKKRTDNKSITAKQVANKLMLQKSICVDCGAKNLVFVKECKPNKKKKQFLQVKKHAYSL